MTVNNNNNGPQLPQPHLATAAGVQMKLTGWTK